MLFHRTSTSLFLSGPVQVCLLFVGPTGPVQVCFYQDQYKFVCCLLVPQDQYKFVCCFVVPTGPVQVCPRRGVGEYGVWEDSNLHPRDAASHGEPAEVGLQDRTLRLPDTVPGERTERGGAGDMKSCIFKFN